MADIIQRITALLSSNAGTVGAAAIQISGGPKANWPLTGVSATFNPNYHRMVLRIVNNHASQSLFVGSNSSLTNAATGGWFKEIGPGQYFDDMSNGSVPRWLVGSAAGTNFTVEEYA